MNVKVHRDVWTQQSTSGVLSMDGEKIGYTLERPEPRFHPDIACIPAGIYPVSLYPSPHFGRVMPLLDVPGHHYIELHYGNYPENSEGCILVGKSRTVDAIWDTREMFDELFEDIYGAIQSGQAVSVTVEEAMFVSDPELGL